ncbi:uncharacterized protein BKA78DRAFT_314877 [Phyllosticta capitalensis]|uniref:uncharacterized protein n=1 Tax=Phyllosticta capitalensis TaxID=121624 RepID=UPI00312FCC86
MAFFIPGTKCTFCFPRVKRCLSGVAVGCPTDQPSSLQRVQIVRVPGTGRCLPRRRAPLSPGPVPACLPAFRVPAETRCLDCDVMQVWCLHACRRFLFVLWSVRSFLHLRPSSLCTLPLS